MVLRVRLYLSDLRSVRCLQQLSMAGSSAWSACGHAWKPEWPAPSSIGLRELGNCGGSNRETRSRRQPVRLPVLQGQPCTPQSGAQSIQEEGVAFNRGFALISKKDQR